MLDERAIFSCIILNLALPLIFTCVFFFIFVLTSKHIHGAKKSIDATYVVKFITTKYDYTEHFVTRTEYIPKLERKKDEMA